MPRIQWPRWLESTRLWTSATLLVLLIRFPLHFLFEPPYLMDLDVFRMVADRVAHGHAALLYQPTTSAVMLFKYAPCWAVIVLPLSWLSSHAAALWWASLTVLWLGLSCVLTARLCRIANLNPPAWLAPAVVLLLVRPITAEFLNGQVDMLWALLVLACVWAEAQGRSGRAAFWLSLAISLKLPSAVVLLGMFARGRIRLSLLTLAWLLALNIGAAVALQPHQPWSIFHDWASVLWSSGTTRAYEIGNQTLLALIARFFSLDPYGLHLLALPKTTIPPLALAVFLGLVAAVIIPRVRSSPSVTLLFDGALLTTLMMLGSPTAWVATYSALILPMSVAVCGLRLTWRRHDPVHVLLSGGVGILSVLTHNSFWRRLGITSLRGESYIYLVLMILPWLGLALFAVLWWQRRQIGRAAAADI